MRTVLWPVLFVLAAAVVPRPAAAQAVPESTARSAAQAARDTTIHAAERAAREWLWLLDEQRYADAWALVAPAMQSAITYERWTTSLTELRAVLPPLLRRELQRAERSVPLFGGESVILSFRVDALREIVVLVRRAGKWQVGGYGILRN